MGVKKRFTATQVADAVKQAKGYVSKAADLLDCDPRTIYNYADQYEAVRDAIASVRERRHDYVESKLMSRIDSEDTTAIIFYLKTQCKDRGYVERTQQEVTGRDGGPIEHDHRSELLRKLSALAGDSGRTVAVQDGGAFATGGTDADPELVGTE